MQIYHQYQPENQILRSPTNGGQPEGPFTVSTTRLLQLILLTVTVLVPPERQALSPVPTWECVHVELTKDRFGRAWLTRHPWFFFFLNDQLQPCRLVVGRRFPNLLHTYHAVNSTIHPAFASLFHMQSELDMGVCVGAYHRKCLHQDSNPRILVLLDDIHGRCHLVITKE